MSHQIGHQDINYIGIKGYALHSSKYYSNCQHRGQSRRARIWTQEATGGFGDDNAAKICRSDQDRALKFYTEKLGFEVSTDQVFNEEQRWIELRIANSPTRVVLFTPEGHENRVGTFFNGSFACDDVSATYRQLKARGVTVVEEPQKQPWGEFAVFKDPDGNQFVLSSS
jgi:predicted enzyme related to lactoylglutathione lyase